MEKSENSIYRWLSTVPEDRQSPGAMGAEESGGGRYTCPLPTPGRTAHVDAMEKAHPLTSLPTALEMTDVSPDIRWPRFSKRKRQSPIREEQPRDQSLAKELGNEYERKPRNRTRKDRYEYKTAGSSNQISSNADKQKTKRRLRSRKQTMNEGFRASNVARNRLTLPNTANLGIFNRSKASSPIILRDVSNLALSGTRRLPREGTRNTWESPTTINKPSKKEANCVYESFNSRNHDILEQRDTSPTKARPEGSTQYLGGRQWTDAMTPQYWLSPSKRPSLDSPKNLVTALQEPRESECQRANSVHKTQSATPYTWSESDQATPSLEPVLRDYLLNVLHVGVPHPGIERYGNSKVYYTLEDLKTLLEARKASWESRASDIQATFRRASSLDLQPEPTAPAGGILGGVPPNSISLLNTSIGEGNTKLALGKNPEQDVSFSSQHQLDKKEIGSDSLPPDQNPRMVYADINDDDVFIRALDAEFCAIMRPSSKDPEPPRQNSEAHKGLQNVDVYQHTDVYSPDSFDRLLYEDIGSGVPYTTSPPVDCHNAQAGLATCPSSGRMLQMRPTSDVHIDQVSDYARVAGPRPLFASTSAPALGHATLPPGFWRQNRLY